MALLGRILGSPYSQAAPDNDPARADPAHQVNSLSLTLGFGRRRLLRLEIGQSARSDDAERMSVVARMVPAPRDEASNDQARRVPQNGTGNSRRHDATTVSFWAALDPTEREALRSVANWRTFAAGATIMKEGDQADHVIVILGGRTTISVTEDGRERILAERGLGQLVGERGALQVSVRSATVIALELVWALVVQTRDFAAFTTAHPRVLALVQDQHDDRGTGELPRYGQADQPDSFTRGRPAPLNGENCTVIFSDVVAFGAVTRTDPDRLIIRDALARMTNAALHGLPDVRLEDRGDGTLIVIPPNVSTAKVMEQLLQELPGGLDRHNRSQRGPVQFQLRLAINVGPVVSDTAGVSGEAIIVAARLLEAPDFKEALANSTAHLGVIASPFVYETVVRHVQDSSYAGSYSQIPVKVKGFGTTAWMRLFDVSLQESVAQHGTV
jgi:hypothetical protein